MFHQSNRGDQMIDQIINNGNIDINNIDSNYDSIIFSTVAGATTVPNFIDSYKTIKYSWNAKKNLKNQLKDAKTINRQNKLKDRIDKHDSIFWNNIYFKIVNEGVKKGIYYSIDSFGNGD